MKKLLNEWRQFLKESQEFDEEEMVNALNKNGRDYYGLIDDLNDLGYEATDSAALIQKYIMDRDRNYKPPKVKEFIADHPEGVYILVHQPLMGIGTVNLLINGDQISGDQKLIGGRAVLGPAGVVKGKEE
jgi:hypothetical protein|tara:strand:+ start:441 stop:830 length:390 start_codon:yes stop_codon:yes gene_type:complete